MTPRCDAIALPSLVFYGMMTLGPIGNQRGVADTDVQTSDNSFILRAASLDTLPIERGRKYYAYLQMQSTFVVYGGAFEEEATL